MTGFPAQQSKSSNGFVPGIRSATLCTSRLHPTCSPSVKTSSQRRPLARWESPGRLEYQIRDLVHACKALWERLDKGYQIFIMASGRSLSPRKVGPPLACHMVESFDFELVTSLYIRMLQAALRYFLIRFSLFVFLARSCTLSSAGVSLIHLSRQSSIHCRAACFPLVS